MINQVYSLLAIILYSYSRLHGKDNLRQTNLHPKFLGVSSPLCDMSGGAHVEE